MSASIESGNKRAESDEPAAHLKNVDRTKMKRQTLTALLVLCGLSGCGKPAESDPMSNARSNLVRNYTLSNGSMVELTQYDCFRPMRKAKNGEGYVECQAMLKGFAHAEVHFCSTIERGSCSAVRPEE